MYLLLCAALDAWVRTQQTFCPCPLALKYLNSACIKRWPWCRYVTNTRVKFVLVVDEPVPKDEEMRMVRHFAASAEC